MHKVNWYYRIVLLLSIFLTGYGQSNLEIPLSPYNDEVIHHSAYSLGYCEEHEQARWVAYELTATELSGNQQRKDNFRADPSVSTMSASLADYRGSGYDRGHLAPAADMKLNSNYMSESFYMSNMSPQKPGFNRGVWKNLEGVVRKMALGCRAVYVVTGPIFVSNKGSIGSNQATVPGYYYKVILDYREPTFRAIGFILPNEPSSKTLSSFAVCVDAVEARTGLDFFAALPDALESQLESRFKYADWNVKDVTSSRTKSKTCAGITKSGNRCMRVVKGEDTYCFQHKPSVSSTPPSIKPSTTSDNRCQALTQKGTQCKRKAKAGSRYCWQHEKHTQN